jgi:membrane-associated phospholipid phosphatase
MSIFSRPFAAVALFAIFLIAFWFGGPDNPIDAIAVERLANIRLAAPQLSEFIVALTHLGSVYVTLGLGFGISLWLFLKGDRGRAALLAATVASERLIVDGLKLAVGRSRPLFDEHPVLTHSFSFPSGHAANTMAVFMSVALIAAPRQYRGIAIAAAVTASVAIGLTRPILGVHWPSDVLGGWALGLLIAMGAVWIGQKSGAIEAQHDVVGRHRHAIREDKAA